MEDLLTTKQVQELLKVNRITIYRMIQDGRLAGVKIGKHWRFPLSEVEKLLHVNSESPVLESKQEISSLPVHCMQTIQDIFADLGDVGALIIDPEGGFVTEPSNLCAFCSLIQSTEEGKKACQKSWYELATQTEWHNKLFTCHAGVQYISRVITEKKETVAVLIVGQGYFDEKGVAAKTRDYQEIANRYNWRVERVVQAASSLPQYKEEQIARINNWADKVVSAFNSILDERAQYIGRLKKITEISSLI